ncbi:MAG TPA: TonB family protein, partial [Gemmatimonadaceae bacterium]|nr:TonB family protein [Gemmatimonadaceae bacterium]
KEIIYQATPAEPVRRPEPATAGPSAPGPVVPTLPTLPNLTVSEIPSTIPPAGEAIDQAAIDALNQGFRPGGSLVGAAGGGAGVAAVATDGVYDAHMVDKAVVSVGDNPIPRYPEMLRQASIGGTVLAQFVVDTLGRVDLRSIRVLRSDHELFSDAVRLNLPRMRFLPAQVGDRKVPQLVQMPFTFAVTDR